MIPLYLYIHTPTHIYFLSFIVRTLSHFFVSLSMTTRMPNMTTLNHLFDLPGQICHVQCGFCTTILLVYLNFFSFISLHLYMYDHLMKYMCYTGECAVHKPVNGGDCEMWALHKPPLCQFDEGFLHSSPSPCFSLSSRWGSGNISTMHMVSIYLYKYGSL